MSTYGLWVAAIDALDVFDINLTANCHKLWHGRSVTQTSALAKHNTASVFSN